MNPYFIYEITPRCNSNCLYCYNVWKQDQSYPQEELPLSKIKELFERILAENNLAGVTLAGGEPLLHPDIVKVAAFLKIKKVRVGLATNGSLLDESMTRKLIDAGIDYFEISLPGVEEQTYQALTRTDYFRESRQAILKAKKYKAKVTVATIITKLNLADFNEIIDLCLAFSVDSLALNRFVPGGAGLEHLADLAISAEELAAVLFRLNDQNREYCFPVNITIPVESCVIEHSKYPYLNFGTCACGQIKWVIDPSGNLRTCEQNPEIIGNLFKNEFKDLAQSLTVKEFQSNDLKADCRECARYQNCGGGCRFCRS
ncbi:MAG: radical SAM protein [Elusimicrobia bacterium]|nr:radical SAM protein [Elusimicrobiota bacterium]